ncbi:cytochrome P450 2G1-like isoform X3 [Lepidochelys kempii]|uniref:cytochrome P450 2G1-like isoform X3 n=1 Tax=Lepidochelys kempii TaxID=8472 RepID=UPI003C702246
MPRMAPSPLTEQPAYNSQVGAVSLPFTSCAGHGARRSRDHIPGYLPLLSGSPFGLEENAPGGEAAPGADPSALPRQLAAAEDQRDLQVVHGAAGQVRPGVHGAPGPAAGGGAVRARGGEGGPGGPGRGVQRQRGAGVHRPEFPWFRGGFGQRATVAAAAPVLPRHPEGLRHGEAVHRGADPGGGPVPAGGVPENQRSAGLPFDPIFFLSRTVSNVISAVVFGSRFDYEDETFLSLLRMINESFIEMSTPWAQLYDMYSCVMQYLPGPHHRIYHLIEDLKAFVAQRVTINQASLDPSAPRDFIDCFLIQMEKQADSVVTRCPSPLSADPREAFHRPAGPPRLLVMTRLWWAAAVSVSGGSAQVSDRPLQGRLSTAPSCVRLPQEKQNPNSEFNTKNLVLTTLNLFFAGTETVSSTLRYGFLLLMKHPGVEEKVHQEIDQVIGRDRVPASEDRMKMPYTDAVIHEIQRVTDIVPMGVPHTVIRDTQFRGYTLPKGTDVFPLLGSVLRDAKYFSNPEEFNPGHFLDENGRFKKNKAFVPFSSGKRVCLGEAMARMELFLYFTTILQSFSLKPLLPPEDIDVSRKVSGFGNVPPTYEMCLVPR